MLYLTLAVSLILIVLLLDRGRVTPLTVCLLFLLFIGDGYYRIDSSNGHTWIIYYCSIVVLVIGWYIHKFITLVVRGKSFHGDSGVKRVEKKSVVVVFWVILFLLLVDHFYSSGIPIFANNIEVSRFEFNSGGLFGISGRIYLFGLPFLVGYMRYCYKLNQSDFIKRLLLITWIVFILSEVVSGFKGGLITVFTFWIVLEGTVSKPINLRRFLSIRNLVFIITAVLFANFIAHQYATISYRWSNIWMYMVDRLTIIPAQPGYYAMNVLSKFMIHGSYNLNDFLYFIQEYSHLKFVSQPIFPIDKTVSAALTHTPLSPDSFIVPVTVGMYPDLFLDCGLLPSYLAMLFTGVLFSYVVSKGKTATTSFSGATWGLASWMMCVLIQNGGIAYSLINFIAMIMILSIIRGISLILSRIFYRSTPAGELKSTINYQNFNL